MASPLKSPGSPPSDGSRRVPPAPSPRPVLASALLAPPWSPAVITDRSRSCPLTSLTGVLSGGNGGPCSRLIPAGTQALPGWVPLGALRLGPRGSSVLPSRNRSGIPSPVANPAFRPPPCDLGCITIGGCSRLAGLTPSGPLRPSRQRRRRAQPALPPARRLPGAPGTVLLLPRSGSGPILSGAAASFLVPGAGRTPLGVPVPLESCPSRLLQLSPLPHEAFMALALSPAASCPAPLLPALTARSRRLRPPGLRGSEGPISASSPSVPSGSLGPDSVAGGVRSCGSVTSVPDLPRRARGCSLSLPLALPGPAPC